MPLYEVRDEHDGLRAHNLVKAAAEKIVANQAKYIPAHPFHVVRQPAKPRSAYGQSIVRAVRTR